jgi:signal transduction histidine kinase
MPSGLNTTTQLEQEIATLREELRQTRAMAALGELTSTTAHEFNNALTTILNYAKLGLRHPDDATRTKALEKIMKAAERANKITNSVLGMARNRGNDPAPTDLAALVEETLVLLERELAKYRVAVVTQLDSVPPAMVVGNQIQQVLLNLLTNARQAMPTGGQVVVTLSLDPATAMLALGVRDTGTGIPADLLPKLFERGFTTKSGPDATGKGGTGVGLFTCRETVERVGGRIRVESAVGRGTLFTLLLPVASRQACDPTAQPVVKLGAQVSLA